ncbi:zinc metalloprotease HtpX [Phaeacidiphilus oryzae]|uniref:zinc metalloprotease HtpX n=1 Tax=Phaeacidiphilus oryzae TaxID=348818 RepID=UPI000A0646F9|nr:zinc metalloprotease HtpX [Phaeacidiphilus oryzae]
MSTERSRAGRSGAGRSGGAGHRRASRQASGRTRFRPDRQLTVRMVLTMFLLGLLYVAFVAALLALLRSWVLVVVIAAGLLLVQYWYSDRIALYAMRAHEVGPDREPRLHGAVDRLCATANMPKPRIAISPTDMPNAFATGRNADHAVLCVTTGLLRRLEADELEGVLAHELSHVAHRDVAVITIASFLGVLAGLMVRFAFYSQLFGGRSRNDQNTAALLGLVMLVSAVVYAISFLLIRALSRYRELAADRSAALLTARPSALASALTKVIGEIARIPTRDLRTAQPFNAFFFTPALGRGASIFGLFSTHPSLDRRLDQLARIAVELGRPAGPGG